MNCREVRRWLSPYLDSELGKTKTFEVSEHLRLCAACATRFERERRVDALMVEKFSDVPVMDFGAMLREAVRPRRPLLGPWRMGVTGLAACVALLVWSSVGSSPTSATAVEDWIASQFASVASDARAFVPVSDASVDLLGQVESSMGVALAMRSAEEAFPGHIIELISVTNRKMDDGAPYVEVRLNCCGNPVLVAFAPRRAMDKLGPFPDGIESGVIRRHQSSGLNIATWASGEFVFVAAAHHAVDNFASAFSVKAA